MLCRKCQKIMLCTQYRYIQCYVEMVKRLCYVHNVDTFNAMSKGLKDYVMLKQGTYTTLLITFLILNQFSIPKKVLESSDLDLSNHTIQCYVC